MNEVVCSLGIPPINLILVNISAMAADLLRFAFAGQEPIRVAGWAATASQLEGLLNDCSPDVALVRSGGLRQESNALPFLEQLRSMSSTVRPIVMSEDMSREECRLLFPSRGAWLDLQIADRSVPTREVHTLRGRGTGLGEFRAA